MLTLIGNSMIGLSGTLFYLLESGKNPKITHFIDAIWWGFSTATTTGYGDITPVTIPGKILGILLMLMGMALFAMYTGLFAEIILTSAKKNR
jgi:voltage-gated potassium channel